MAAAARCKCCLPPPMGAGGRALHTLPGACLSLSQGEGLICHVYLEKTEGCTKGGTSESLGATHSP